MKLDLQPLVDAAVMLDQEDAEVRRGKATLAALEERVSTATPVSLGWRLRELGTWSDRTVDSRWTAPSVQERLRVRIGRDEDHPEVMALMGDLLTKARATCSSLLRLRRRIRDLEMVLVGAVKDLRDQSLDARLLRLIPETGETMTAQEMHGTVEKDHAEIADAIATWKLSNGAAAVLSVREHSTLRDVQQALHRLEHAGHAHRSGRFLSVPRWTATQTSQEVRKRA